MSRELHVVPFRVSFRTHLPSKVLRLPWCCVEPWLAAVSRRDLVRFTAGWVQDQFRLRSLCPGPCHGRAHAFDGQGRWIPLPHVPAHLRLHPRVLGTSPLTRFRREQQFHPRDSLHTTYHVSLSCFTVIQYRCRQVQALRVCRANDVWVTKLLLMEIWVGGVSFSSIQNQTQVERGHL